MKCIWDKTWILITLLGIFGESYARQVPWKSLNSSWQRHTIDASSRGADGVKVADANGDGLMDVVTGWEEGGVVHVYIHPGYEHVKAPWPRIVVGRVPHVEDAMFIDVDNDGLYDVVSATEGDERSMFLHKAPGKIDVYMDSLAWETRPLEITRNRMQWMFAIPFDVGSDGTTEIVAAGKNEGAEIGWIEGLGGEEVTWHPRATVGWVMSIIPIDMDLDGDLDILYSDRKKGGRGVYLMPNGENVLEKNPIYLGGYDRELMFMDVGDLDGDQAVEIVAATAGDEIRITSGAYDVGYRSASLWLPKTTGTGKGVAIGDLTGNGLQDIAVTTEHAEGKHGVFFLEQQELGKWYAVDIGGIEGTKFDRIELLDLDNDGDLDLLTCEEVENLGVIWYENPSF